ncbi:hypothetical protein NAL32_05420 [Chryseobacterium sp. Ch-15]|uniref:Lipoprotein n=1 Tax=Chryseobacterium muglaense TaxID=2893752 RepID=A0A9Q3YPX0_9FLAO|nr:MULTISPECIES: hypothetical protein [Chryseobacterium]MBD3904092.1 hypothetical protein [Chryseobacterium muglaense]MBO6185997.1 hypothetical protein [Chryseobacterium sp.]MCC9033336.1 hypothetical protein [Chryseobacterium muglaense]MCM2553831.1 hypothetical protein [Chryseobacterium muglaense]
MKTLISIFLVLTILMSSISCRVQDDDFETNEIASSTELQLANKKSNDTATTKFINSLGDPPPKNGTQWRIKK